MTTMKAHHIFLLTLAFLTACHSPEYFAQKGDYDKAKIPMLPNIAGRPETRKQILIYSALLVPTVALLVVASHRVLGPGTRSENARGSTPARAPTQLP